MNSLGVLVGFILIIILNSKKVDIGIAFLIGAIATAILSNLNLSKTFSIFYKTAVDPLTLKLTVIVTIISGLGYLLKQTGDLDIMINSLVEIFKNNKILCMLIPSLFGSLAVPGGAILSAPILSESADRINIGQPRKTAVNLFFRHVGFLIYPLYSAIIVTGELFKVSKLTFIKYNFLVMVVGIIVAYLTFFNSNHQENINKDKDKKVKNEKLLKNNIISFLLSFSPILIILILVIGFSIPFSGAVFSGLIIGLIRNLPENGKIQTVWKRLLDFFAYGIKYKLILVILGIMLFKNIVEATGAVTSIASLMASSGIPISLMILLLGFTVGLLMGIETGAIGILIPIFLPLLPAHNPGSFIALLFTCSFCGYLVSPVHLCLILTKEYYETRFLPIYRLLAIPVLSMITAAFIQYYIFI